MQIERNTRGLEINRTVMNPKSVRERISVKRRVNDSWKERGDLGRWLRLSSHPSLTSLALAGTSVVDWAWTGLGRSWGYVSPCRLASLR